MSPGLIAFLVCLGIAVIVSVPLVISKMSSNRNTHRRPGPEKPATSAPAAPAAGGHDAHASHSDHGHAKAEPWKGFWKNPVKFIGGWSVAFAIVIVVLLFGWFDGHVAKFVISHMHGDPPHASAKQEPATTETDDHASNKSDAWPTISAPAKASGLADEDQVWSESVAIPAGKSIQHPMPPEKAGYLVQCHETGTDASIWHNEADGPCGSADAEHYLSIKTDDSEQLIPQDVSYRIVTP